MVKSVKNKVERFYSTDEFLIRNPSLYEEDSLWKIQRIMPLSSFLTRAPCFVTLMVNNRSKLELRGILIGGELE